jgi:hypothetical protein
MFFRCGLILCILRMSWSMHSPWSLHAFFDGSKPYFNVEKLRVVHDGACSRET